MLTGKTLYDSLAALRKGGLRSGDPVKGINGTLRHRSGQFSKLGVNPRPFYSECGPYQTLFIDELMHNGPLRKFCICFGKPDINLYFICKPDLFDKHAFFPEYNRAKMLLLHYLKSYTQLIQNFNTMLGRQIVITAMPEMIGGIQVRPTKRYFFAKKSHLRPI